MIASLDGSTALDGRSTGLGNDGDRAVFAALRRAADVVLVGAATVRAEGYGAPRRRPAHRRRHGVRRRRPVGRAVRVRRRVPDHARGRAARSRRSTSSRRVGRVDLASACPTRRHHGSADVRAIGGWSAAQRALLDAGCVDEIDLSLAPLVVGGPGCASSRVPQTRLAVRPPTCRRRRRLPLQSLGAANTLTSPGRIARITRWVHR